jgi:hypothetical protein
MFPTGTNAGVRLMTDGGIWMQANNNTTVTPAPGQFVLSCPSGTIFVGTGAERVNINGSPLSFFSSAGTGLQTVTGSRAGNAALASLLTALANYGLITNSSTA